MLKLNLFKNKVLFLFNIIKIEFQINFFNLFIKINILLKD